MSKTISFVITEMDHSLLEEASAREGVNLVEEAAKVFARGLRATHLLRAEQVVVLDEMLREETAERSRAAENILKFETNGAAANAQAFQTMVESDDFKNEFRKLVQANKDRAKKATPPIELAP